MNHSFGLALTRETNHNADMGEDLMQPIVYMLWHTYEMDSGVEESKLIGVYSSEERAREALEQVRFQPGFRDHPEGFLIDEMRLDRTSWVSGFSSAPDTDEDEGESIGNGGGS